MDEIYLSRLLFLLTIVEKLLILFDPNDVKTDLIPMLFVGIQHRNRYLNDFSHFLFGSIFAKDYSYRAKLVPSYIRLSLEVPLF